MRPFAQRPVDLGDPLAAGADRARGLGDRGEQRHLVHGVEAELPVLRRPAPVDVEERSEGVEAEPRLRQIDERRGDVRLEVDHRRARELDLAQAAQDPGGVGRERQILLVAPDPPLAAVDRLADLEAPSVGEEAAPELRHRAPPALAIAHQLAQLRQREGQLQAASGERASERLLRRVLLLPGVEPQQDLAHSEVVDRREQRRRVFGRGAKRHAGAGPVEGSARVGAGELPIAPPDAGHRARQGHQAAHLRGQVRETHPDALEAAGVRVRLVREVVPDALVAGRCAHGRRRDVGVGPARHQPALEPLAGGSEAVLEAVLGGEAAAGALVDRAPPRRNRLALEIDREEPLAISGPLERQPAEVEHPLARADARLPPAAVEVEQRDIGDLLRASPGRHQEVPDRQIAMVEAGVVEPPRQAGDGGEEHRAVDPGKLFAVPPRVPRPEEVARLDAPDEALRGVDRDPRGILALGHQERRRRRDARRRQGAGHREAASRLPLAAAPPPPLTPRVPAKLLDRDLELAVGHLEPGGVDVVAPPVQRLGRAAGVEQVASGRHEVGAGQALRRLSSEPRPGEGDRGHISRISKLDGWSLASACTITAKPSSRSSSSRMARSSRWSAFATSG